VVTVVETLRTPRRFAVPQAEDQRSVLTKGVGRLLHPRILRFGSHLIAGINPIATTAGHGS
jgi:hypothetical protein